jgi:AcrR family transcriptional regulator
MWPTASICVKAINGSAFRLNTEHRSVYQEALMDEPTKAPTGRKPSPERGVRADAKRNLDALLEAAKTVFAEAGVDAPVRDIAARAGVGVATVYRHFPQRAQLIAAVFRREIDACADAATTLLAEHAPDEALSLWMQRFAAFMATKRGLAVALHSGDPAYEGLASLFEGKLVSALDALLKAAVAGGHISGGVEAFELLNAVARLCMQSQGDRPGHEERMVALLVDGLRYGARPRG